MTSRGEGQAVGTRRLATASLLLGIFVLFDLGLLGWLIFRSLSQREIERVLLETREEAEELARQLASGVSEHGKDLYTLVAVEREKQTYIDSILQKRDVVQTIEIRDKDGKLVFRALAETFLPPQPGDPLRIESREGAPSTEIVTSESERTMDYDMDVPIGELGFLHIGISAVEMQKRIGVLRGELVRQTSLIGAVTLAVLLLAYLTIVWLWRRGRRLEVQAAEAERMAYIGTLASGLAHEIRNPLNSLSLNMQLLEEEAGAPVPRESTRRLLAITQKEIARLERLVTDFLSYARPRPLELETVPAAALLGRCRDILRREAEERGIDLVVEDQTDGARVRVDCEQMTQLLLNLVQNSLAATESTGRRGRVRLRAERHGGKVVLEVSDNGAGIPAAELGRIFDLFYSTKKGGTGLGLAVVRRIAQAHGGEIDIGSVAGRGTTIRLPLEEVVEREAELPAPVRVGPSVPAQPGSR